MKFKPLVSSLALALLATTSSGCGTEPRRSQAEAPSRSHREPGPWLPVHEAELPTLDENRIGRVGFPGRPQLVERSELALPPDHPLSKRGGTIIVEAIIGTSGNIVKARVIAGPDDAEVRANVVQCLRSWKFTPATYEGEPWAVGMYLSLNVPAP